MDDRGIGKNPYDEPVWRAIATVIREPFTGTSTELHRLLLTSGVEGLPESGRMVSAIIDRIAPWMQHWQFRRKFRGGYRPWVITPPGFYWDSRGFWHSIAEDAAREESVRRLTR